MPLKIYAEFMSSLFSSWLDFEHADKAYQRRIYRAKHRRKLAYLEFATASVRHFRSFASELIRLASNESRNAKQS